MLFSATVPFDAEAAFLNRIRAPEAPPTWRIRGIVDSLSPLHTWLDTFGQEDPEVALIQGLVDDGMDPGDVRDLEGVSLMHAAAKNNRARLLPILHAGMVRQGEHTIDLREGTSDLTPLLIAAMYGAGDSVCALLALGADVRLVDNGRNTALHQMATALKPQPDGVPDPLMALLDAGAPVNVKNGEGWTPLHCAALSNRAFVVRQILNAGGKLDLVDRAKETPLQMAERLEYLESAAVLREAMIAREASTLRRAMGKPPSAPVAAPARRRL